MQLPGAVVSLPQHAGLGGGGCGAAVAAARASAPCGCTVWPCERAIRPCARCAAARATTSRGGQLAPQRPARPAHPSPLPVPLPAPLCSCPTSQLVVGKPASHTSHVARAPSPPRARVTPLPVLATHPWRTQSLAASIVTDAATSVRLEVTRAFAPIVLLAALVRFDPRVSMVQSMFNSLAPELLDTVGGERRRPRRGGGALQAGTGLTHVRV